MADHRGAEASVSAFFTPATTLDPSSQAAKEPADLVLRPRSTGSSISHAEIGHLEFVPFEEKLRSVGLGARVGIAIAHVQRSRMTIAIKADASTKIIKSSPKDRRRSSCPQQKRSHFAGLGPRRGQTVPPILPGTKCAPRRASFPFLAGQNRLPRSPLPAVATAILDPGRSARSLPVSSKKRRSQCAKFSTQRRSVHAQTTAFTLDDRANGEIHSSSANTEHVGTSSRNTVHGSCSSHIYSLHSTNCVEST